MSTYPAIRIVLLILLWPGLAFSAEDYEKFFGQYHGETIDSSTGKDVKRNLDVTVKKVKKGFNVSWETTTIKSDGRIKTKAYSINFIPSERDHIYSSAMKTNLFGGQQALDPLKGDPYVWARISGDTLTMHALVINDEGGFEMQTFDRTLVEGGLRLNFTRIGDGHELKRIETELKRQ